MPLVRPVDAMAIRHGIDGEFSRISTLAAVTLHQMAVAFAVVLDVGMKAGVTVGRPVVTGATPGEPGR